MKVTVQRKAEIWVENYYEIGDESQIEDAINYDIDAIDTEVLWETLEDLGPVEVYDEDWKLLYSNVKDE